jgi:hypothetical protein
MTPSGIEPATFRFVAQYLNHCATAVPRIGNQILQLAYTPVFKLHHLSSHEIRRNCFQESALHYTQPAKELNDAVPEAHKRRYLLT